MKRGGRAGGVAGGRGGRGGRRSEGESRKTSDELNATIPEGEAVQKNEPVKKEQEVIVKVSRSWTETDLNHYFSGRQTACREGSQ